MAFFGSSIFWGLFHQNRRPTRLETVFFIFGLLSFVTLFSYEVFDPSPLNLLQPIGGIQNWLGLPGALYAGFIIELFGLFAFALPVLTVFTRPRFGQSGFKVVLMTFVEIFLLVSCASLLIQGESHLLVQYTGIWGVLSNQSLIKFPGLIISLVIIFFYQFLFIRFFYFNNTLFVVLWKLSWIVILFTQKIYLRFKGDIIRLWRFGSINWMIPLRLVFTRIVEKTNLWIKSSLQRILTAIFQIDTFQRLKKMGDSIFTKIERRHFNVKIDGGETESQVVYKTKYDALSRAIIEYKKRYYASDRTHFVNSRK